MSAYREVLLSVDSGPSPPDSQESHLQPDSREGQLV